MPFLSLEYSNSNSNNLPPFLCALQLLDSLSVEEAQKRNILSNIKFSEENPNVYEDLKKSIRLFKGSLIEDENKDEDVAMYGETNSRGRSQRREPYNQRNCDRYG